MNRRTELNDKSSRKLGHSLNSYIFSAYKKDPVLAATLGTLLENGRVYAFGQKLAKYLFSANLTVDVFKAPLSPKLALLRAQDIYFVQTDDLKLLQRISSKTCAQVVLVSDTIQAPEVFFDYKINFLKLKIFCHTLRKNMKFLKNTTDFIQFKNLVERPAVFLDRDGVIIKHIDHISNPEDVKLTPGIAQFIKKFRKKGYAIVVITNQSGIGRQFFSWQDYDLVTQKMLQLLANEKTYIDRVIHSPFFENSKLAAGLVRKSLRKPRAGMILSIANELNLKLSRSILVGDRSTDIMAAMLAELNKAYLINSDFFQEELKACKIITSSTQFKFKTLFATVKNIKDIKVS